jgi:hypothetical protein
MIFFLLLLILYAVYRKSEENQLFTVERAMADGRSRLIIIG